MARKRKQQPTASKDQAQAINITQQHITIRPANRQASDIQDWKRAIQAAESVANPRRVLLYDLYDNIMLDGHLTGVAAKYINAVVGAEWEFSKDGETIDHVNDLIDTNEFEKVLTEIVSSKLWGVSWMEFSNFTKEGFCVWPVPRKHIRPETGIITREQSGDDGLNIREGVYAKTFMEVGDKNDLGLLMKVAQYIIYKRGNFGDWAQFAEIFGMPFRWAEYDAHDEAQRAQLNEALDKAGSAAYAAIPKGAALHFEKNPSTGDGQLYKLLKDACNQEVSVTLLGVTETTTSSSASGYAQSETHSHEQEKVFKGLRDFTRRVLNRNFIPILEAAGIDTKGGYFIVKGEGEEKLTLKERYEIHRSMVVELGLPKDDDSFYEIYGMSKPADYEAQRKGGASPSPAVGAGQHPPNDQDLPEDTPPDKTELSASKALWQKVAHFFDHAPQG